MGAEGVRNSDRVYLELPIVLSGTDAAGREFVEETRTLVLSRSGAKILSQHSLEPQQKLRIHCLETGRKSDLRVAGCIGGDEEGSYYGVEVLDAGADFWGINFPSLTTGENAAGRALLECKRCHSRAVAHLDAFEIEVLLANSFLMRNCSRCAETSIWESPSPASERPVSSETPSTSSHLLHLRKDARVNLKVDVCIRHAVFGEEIAVTENVSRGGFRFRSSRDYPVASLIEAALPYVPGAANVFAPARIVHKDEVSQPGGENGYGAAYVPAQMAGSLTGMRISRPE